MHQEGILIRAPSRCPRRGCIMGKPKAKKAVDIDPETAEALMKQIEAHSCLDIDSLLEVLSANQAPCDASVPCKDNKKSNPNCLCALAPLLGSFRKRGLWAKEATPLSSLGDDPWTLARTVRHNRANMYGMVWKGQEPGCMKFLALLESHALSCSSRNSCSSTEMLHS